MKLPYFIWTIRNHIFVKRDVGKQDLWTNYETRDIPRYKTFDNANKPDNSGNGISTQNFMCYFFYYNIILEQNMFY